MGFMRKIYTFLVLAFFVATSASAANFVVTNTNDSGAGSLRQAILNANASVDADNIIFSIPGSGPFTITPVTALPKITGSTSVDGYTQPGSIQPGSTWPAKIKIILDGNGLAESGLYLTPSAFNSSVSGLSIVGFGAVDMNAALHLMGSNSTISGNLIGLLPDGTPKANYAGIYIHGCDNLTIGGSTPESRNVISGNTNEGITVVPALHDGSPTNYSTNHLIQNNFVGTNLYGTAAIGNGMHGIDFDGANNSYILDNVVGGSGQYGLGIDATYAADPPMIYNITVKRNQIGIGVNGENIGNSVAGIMVINAHDIIIGSSVADANIIAYNGTGVIVRDWPSATSGSCYNVQITYNRIYNNIGVGIDLNGDGPTLNDGTDPGPYDADLGPNGLQNYPVIDSAYVKD